MGTEKKQGLGERAGESPLDGESTQQLLERLRSGESEALEALYRRYLPALQRWARGRLPAWARDLMDTNDLVQETLMKTLRAVDRFDPEHSGAFCAYLRRGVKNRLRDEIRRIRRRPRREGTASRVEDARPSPVEEAIGSEMLECFESALERLSDGDREAVLARVELGMSYADLAVALDKPSPDAARMAVRRALRRLAEEMAKA